MRIGLDDRVGYNEFAEKFGTLFVDFKETYTREKSKGKQQLIESDTTASTTELDVSTSSVSTAQ